LADLSAWLPKSVQALRTYDRSTFGSDLLSGVTVGFVALPLAMAFAIASGLPPQAGIYCAIVTGFLISLLGGSRCQVGGPTGAFVVVGGRWRTIEGHGRVDEQLFATRGDEPAQRAEGRIAPPVLVGRHDGLGGPGPPGKLGLGQAPSPPHRPDQLARVHADEYIASSMIPRTDRAGRGPQELQIDAVDVQSLR
jgi:hypothetical protein